MIYTCRLRRFITVIALAFTALVVHGQSTVNHYRNPLDVSIADPHVLKDGDTYYLYGTTETGRGFSVFTSTDLVNWNRRGLCYQKTASSWAQQAFWAPEVIKVGSTYYLYFTGYNPTLERRNICVASSDSPLGPFTDLPSPVMDESMWFIDGHPYHDPVSGKFYMYAVRTQNGPAKIMVTELTNPPVSATGPLTQVLTVSQPWEGTWVEAPFIVRHKNTYYMMYSGSTFDVPRYAVGYATAANPLGPWTKASTNPILRQTATVSGPGHNSAVTSPDGNELFIVYHTHLTFAGGGKRQLAVDRLLFSPRSGQPDVLSVVTGGPTSNLQAIPPGAAPKFYGTGDEFASSDLDRSRWNTFGEEPSRWRLGNGDLVIETQPGDIHTDHHDAKNLFLQYVRPLDFDIETSVNFDPQQNFEQAFVILWEDQSNYIRLAHAHVNRDSIEIGVEKNGQYTATVINNPFGNSMRLKIERRGNTYRCYAGSTSNQNWTPVGSPITFDVVQPQAGIGAIAPVSGARRTARFDYFRITYPSAVNDWHLY